jgi:hypothetical protein
MAVRVAMIVKNGSKLKAESSRQKKDESGTLLLQLKALNDLNHLNDPNHLNLSRLPNEISVALISSGLNLFVFLFNWDHLNALNGG